MDPTALTLNAETGEITLPVGGTGSFIARINLRNGATIDPTNSIILFAVSDRQTISKKEHRSEILRKEFQIQGDAEEGYYVRVDLLNPDTREQRPGRYVWDLTFITDPEYDDQGNIVCGDASDDVVPIFASAGKLPVFNLYEVTTIV